MWELWSGAQTPYLDLRNQEVKGKVNATCGINHFAAIVYYILLIGGSCFFYSY